jgi:hypothetical protein
MKRENSKMPDDDDDKPGLYQGRLPFEAGIDTSEAAAESIAESVTALRRKVLNAVKAAHDGVTCDQVEARLNMRHQTASARIRELSLLGLIEISVVRRKTRSGRYARVYFVSAGGADAA